MLEPKITPLARRLAEENGIDWRRLKGTGPDGTIVERDILAFLAKVMAGEVELPPVPETPPPLPPEEELKRAQEALGREGVDLADLIPEAPKAPTLQVEELDFPELDLSEEEALLLPEEEAPEPLEAWEENPPVPEPPLAQEAGPPPAPQEATPGLLGEAPPAPALWVLVLRRRVDLGALEAALTAFQKVYGVAKTPLPFLLRAAEKALGELALPYPALLGRREGEGVRGLKPSPSFLALFREEGGEEGEGLLCFYGEEEVHTGRPSLFLSPEGVLAASGLEASLARDLLDRVALYLEHPALLLA